MIKLNKEQYIQCYNLFKPMSYNLNCLAVINGDSTGEIWVDQLVIDGNSDVPTQKPNLGVLMDSEFSIYLAGNISETHQELILEIENLLMDELFRAAEEKKEEYSVYISDSSWDAFSNETNI